MANYANLLATIAANIYTNSNNEVTAAMVKTAVDQMVASLGNGYQLAGGATPTTDPNNPDEQLFFLATSPGTYTNFGGVVVNAGEIALLYGSGSSWSKTAMNAASLQMLEGKVDIGFDNILDPADILDGSGFGNAGNLITNAGWATIFGTIVLPWRGQQYITINNCYCSGGFYAWQFTKDMTPITGSGEAGIIGTHTFERINDNAYYLGVTLGANGYLNNHPRANYGQTLTTDLETPNPIRQYLSGVLPNEDIIELYAYAAGSAADTETQFYGWKNGKCAIQRAIDKVTWTQKTIIHFSGHIKVTSTSEFFVGENGLWAIVFVPSTKKNIEIVGEGPDRSSLSVMLPDNTANHQNYEPLEVWGDNCSVKGMAIYAKNCRYCIHEDASARPNANNFTITFEDLLLRHYTNAGGGFNSCLGLGISDGMTLITRRCKFIHQDNGTPSLYVHDGTGYKAGFLWIIEGCVLEHSGSTGLCPLVVQGLGSGVESTIILNELDMGTDSPVIFCDYNRDNSFIRIKGNLSYPIGYLTRATDTGLVLRVTSKTPGAGGSVRFDNTSSAFDYLVGGDFNSDFTDTAGVVHTNGYRYRDGVDVLRGFAQGELSLDTGTARSMQNRLGDCSGSSKELIVTIDGTDYTITFNQNYTNFSDAQMLQEFTNVIGNVADVELYNWGADNFPEMKPSMTHRKNTEASDAILCGMGVHLTAGGMVKATTDAEVDGIVIEDVAPGYFGRVVRKAILSIFESDHHHICLDSYPATDVEKYNYRKSYGIGTTPGVFTEKADGIVYYEWLGYLNINL